MGYRVGYQCVETQQMADDLILSTQSPFLTADGQVLRPVRTTDGWYYQNQKIQLSYPTCEPTQQMYEGAKIGGYFLLLIVTIYGIRLIAGMIKDIFRIQGSSDE